jgi:hypothetical protein
MKAYPTILLSGKSNLVLPIKNAKSIVSFITIGGYHTYTVIW